MKPRRVHAIFPLVIAGVIAIGHSYPGAPAARAQTQSSPRYSPVVRAVQGAAPAVVNIHSEKTLLYEAATSLEPFESGRRINGMGTGVIIDQRGYILTNQHVVEGVQTLKVTVASGEKYPARIVSKDPESDLAIIKIESSRSLSVLPMGTSSDLLLGETVIAIGNAFGYENTVTTGIISALSRSVQVSDQQVYENLIQTNASINPGNSGGPLLNLEGEWIGVNVAIRAGAQGIGFAIPIEKVRQRLPNLFSIKKLRGTWHGIQCRQAREASTAAQWSASAPSAAVVATAQDTRSAEQSIRTDRTPSAIIEAIEPESPASRVGLRAGDRIVEAGGQPIHDPLDLERVLLDAAPGEQVPMLIRREGQELRMNLTLESAPLDLSDPQQLAWRLLGLRVEAMDSLVVRRQSSRYRGGLLVTQVQPKSAADQQGIRRGDVLVGMHIWEVLNLDNLRYVLTQARSGQYDRLKFYILRGREEMFGYFELASNRLWDEHRKTSHTQQR